MKSERVLEDICIDDSGGPPLHYQIRVGMEKIITSGRLRPGDRLPNIVDIASMLDVSHATALKAITELQRKGLIVSKRGVGTVVATRAAGATDIIMPSIVSPPVGTHVWDYHHQILDGLKEGFGESDRAFTMMYMDESICSPGQFLASLRARQVDGVIALNPHDNIYPLLNAAGREMPVVSLFRYIPNSPVHCIAPIVAKPVKNIIQRRIDAGQTDFIYLNDNIICEHDKKPFNIYGTIRDTFDESLKDAGLTSEEIFVDRKYHCRSDIQLDLRRANGKKVNSGATLLIKSPAIFQCLGELIDEMDIITYTESQLSYDMLLNRASFVYFGLEQAAIEATELIINREVPGVGERGRVIRPKPQVIDLVDVKKGGAAR